MFSHLKTRRTQLGIFLFTVAFGTVGTVRDLHADGGQGRGGGALSTAADGSLRIADAGTETPDKHGFIPLKHPYLQKNGRNIRGCTLVAAKLGDEGAEDKSDRHDMLKYNCRGDFKIVRSKMGKGGVRLLLAEDVAREIDKTDVKDYSFRDKARIDAGYVIGSPMYAYEGLKAGLGAAGGAAGSRAGDIGSGFAGLGCDVAHIVKEAPKQVAKKTWGALKAFGRVFKHDHRAKPKDLGDVKPEVEGNAWCAKMHNHGQDSDPEPAVANTHTAEPEKVAATVDTANANTETVELKTCPDGTKASDPSTPLLGYMGLGERCKLKVEPAAGIDAGTDGASFGG